MGTRRIDPYRRRGRGRGLASFVAFVLLFGLALGQGAGSLIALADDAPTTDAVTTEDAPSTDGAATDATATDAASTDPAAATDAASTDASSDGAADADATTDGAVEGAITAAGAGLVDAADTGTKGTKRDQKADRAGASAAPTATGLTGGDVSLDYVAAGPFTYDHSTGVGTPPKFGYDQRTISKSNGVVESLEAGDFECGDYVTFFTQVSIDPDAAGSGTVELDYSFGTETTGQPGLGFVDIISADMNIPDGGNVGNVGDNVVTLSNEFKETQGYDELHGTVSVTNLAPGETAIVRVIVELGCLVGSSPTGNILTAIDAARADGDTVNVGQETVPMKKVEDIAQPGMDVNKTCPAAAAIGDTITYSIDIINTGNEALDLVSVLDTVDGHAADDITDLFPSSIAAGATGSAEYEYTVLDSDPDPLPNSVAVTAEGATSGTTLHGSASCETDITHQPAIDVTKSCPTSVPFGEDIEYTITVENTGDEPLEGVTVTDTLLGDITDQFDVDFSQPFAVGDVATAVVTYSPGANEDPVDNTVTATGTGVDSGAEASDEASCRTDITHAAGIDVTKTCPEFVAIGEDITYTITVENTGNEALESVSVVDSLLGDITDEFDVDLSQPFAPGATASAEVTYTPAAGQDPVTNTVTASGTGVDSQTEVSDVASCTTDILNPGIDIEKTVNDDLVPIGTTVTYTYVVTNTGDTPLYDITVDDDVMGHIGDIPFLGVGDKATLTKDFVVGRDQVINVATARGHDILGREVSADDDAVVNPIAGERPTPPPPTPFTGSDTGRLALLAMILFGLGVTLVAVTRRRKQPPSTTW